MSGIDLTVEPVGVGIAAGVDGDTLFPLNGFRGLFWLFAVVEDSGEVDVVTMAAGEIVVAVSCAGAVADVVTVNVLLSRPDGPRGVVLPATGSENGSTDHWQTMKPVWYSVWAWLHSLV